ncbi:MAG: hypothetical protein DMF88_04595 [Acidobacteria bacterium]|nr:MAG: hypothetical protein DMF88_04595 [Acidobacteriota bacterium]
MFPCPSTMLMMCDHRKSVPLTPTSESSPTLPFTSSAPGGDADVASRHGRRPIGNSMFGPSCGSLIAFGRWMFGSNPRCSA